MYIRLLAVGEKMPAWVCDGYQEYARRFRQDCRLELIEVSPGHRRGGNVDQAREQEAARIAKRMKPGNHVVALDVKGQRWSTEQLAQKMRDWQGLGQDVELLIGGPEGLSPMLLEQANDTWSLSPLTFPHPLVRVIVAEALYRAWSLNHNHPYHRGD
jgi:23S rRNA (pseudouridine1915-N3)-methyltransferase